MPGIVTEERIGQQDVGRLVDQLRTAVAELTFDLLVYQHDCAVGIHDEHAVRKRFSRELEHLKGVLVRETPSGVPARTRYLSEPALCVTGMVCGELGIM